MSNVLPQSFFRRPVADVAEDLLGKFLVRAIGDKEIALMITDVEAYDGPHDKACHASRGRTPRTDVMFGPAGNFYVYLCYGMYWMLNVVTGEEDYPAAVLIRGCASSSTSGAALNGPGKLTRALTIDKTLNTRVAVPETGLWFEDRGFVPGKKDIQKTPRIGVSYAGPAWSKRKLRFVLNT